MHLSGVNDLFVQAIKAEFHYISTNTKTVSLCPEPQALTSYSLCLKPPIIGLNITILKMSVKDLMKVLKHYVNRKV